MEISGERHTENGVSYTLTRKKVKNINLRIGKDGRVLVSASARCPVARIDAFVTEKADWIAAAQQKMEQRETQHLVPCTVTPQDAMALFAAVSSEVFPLFAGVLQNKLPILKVRLMKTRWGVCVPSKRQITLNLRLAEKPRAAVEYVVVHEYAHFLQPNHSAAFWAIVARLMPDYKARQALLKNDFL
ncbi:MAG: YgjP-like metallopeptidase domain-containing protein [Ruthenibacterium sp.]